MKVSSTGRYNSVNIQNRNNQKKSDAQNFKGAGIDAAFNLLDKGFSVLDKNAMIQVSFVDTVSTNIPRTLVDLKTGLAAALETFRREFSGLFVNCLMPGLVVKGLANVLPKAKEFDGTDVVGSWANGASIDRLKGVYNQAQESGAKDKTRVYVEKALGSLEGLDGKNWVKFADKAATPEYTQAVDAITEAIGKTGKERRNLLKQAQTKLVGVTKAENILRFNGAAQSNLEDDLSGAAADSGIPAVYAAFRRGSDPAAGGHPARSAHGGGGESDRQHLLQFLRRTAGYLRSGGAVVCQPGHPWPADGAQPHLRRPRGPGLALYPADLRCLYLRVSAAGRRDAGVPGLRGIPVGPALAGASPPGGPAGGYDRLAQRVAVCCPGVGVRPDLHGPAQPPQPIPAESARCGADGPGLAGLLPCVLPVCGPYAGALHQHLRLRLHRGHRPAVDLLLYVHPAVRRADQPAASAKISR